MNILVATDAWEPQVNGVVRTLKSLANAVRKFDAAITFLTPDGFPSVAVPTYPGLRCALPSPREVAQRIERVAPDAIHIATEGPIGAVVRRYCVKRGLPFTTSYTTRFPEYIAARVPITTLLPGRSSARNAARFFSTATRPTVAKIGRGSPRSIARSGRNRSVSTPRVHMPRFLKPRPASSAISDGVDTMVTRAAAWK
jgi:hypothetical protein